MTPIERAERAIAPELWALLDLWGGDMSKLDAWQRGEIAMSKEKARAVLTAIREPSAAMVEAGRWPAEDDGPVACWTAMIDEAIAPRDSRSDRQAKNIVAG